MYISILLNNRIKKYIIISKHLASGQIQSNGIIISGNVSRGLTFPTGRAVSHPRNHQQWRDSPQSSPCPPLSAGPCSPNSSRSRHSKRSSRRSCRTPRVGRSCRWGAGPSGRGRGSGRGPSGRRTGWTSSDNDGRLRCCFWFDHKSRFP